MQDLPFQTKFRKELESDLGKQLKESLINDLDDLKDLVYRTLVTFDPDVIRDQVRQGFLGAYTIDFILWSGMVAVETRFIRTKNEARKTFDDLVSYIPVLGGTYRYFLFLILHATGSVVDPLEMKNDLEAKSDQLQVIIIGKGD